MNQGVDLYIDAYEEALGALSSRARRHPGWADLQHRLGLLYYGAPTSLAEPLLWLGVAVLAGAALSAVVLRHRSRR